MRALLLNFSRSSTYRSPLTVVDSRRGGRTVRRTIIHMKVIQLRLLALPPRMEMSIGWEIPPMLGQNQLFISVAKIRYRLTIDLAGIITPSQATLCLCYRENESL